MPGFDGRGPTGQGPLTGRGQGYCAVPVKDGGAPQGANWISRAGFMYRQARRLGAGLGFGRGAGRRPRRRRFWL